jgi:hypothetical protein
MPAHRKVGIPPPESAPQIFPGGLPGQVLGTVIEGDGTRIAWITLPNSPGAKGRQGERGSDGVQGPPRSPDKAGPPGPEGKMRPRGYNGPIGPRGETGPPAGRDENMVAQIASLELRIAQLEQRLQPKTIWR